MVNLMKMERWSGYQSGFTIVELLIVVVVIAILAAITVISYNGITTQAVASIARSDLANIGKQLEIFKVNNGAYPHIDASSSTSLDDLAQVIRNASLYADTRANIDPMDPQQTAHDKKSFVFCVNPDKSMIFVIAMRPVVDGFDSGNLSLSVGKRLLYYKTGSGSGETTFQYTPGINSTGVNACKSVESAFDTANSWALRWSFDTPTLKAP